MRLSYHMYHDLTVYLLDDSKNAVKLPFSFLFPNIIKQLPVIDTHTHSFLTLESES